MRKHIRASIPFSIRELAKITYHYAIENNGATIYPMTGIPANTGYAVGGIANSMKVDRITEDIIYDFINRYLKHYIDFSSGGFYADNGFFIGVWFDVKENKWYLEPSEIYFNETAAQHKAKEREVNWLIMICMKIQTKIRTAHLILKRNNIDVIVS